MLQRIRDRITGWVAGAILALLTVVFVFWGIDFQAGIDSFAVRVNGEKVSLNSVRRAWQEQLSRLQQATTGQLPPEFLESQQKALIDGFVRETLLKQRADDQGYRTSDRMLIETIRSFPELQVDGNFSRDRYAALLRQQGRTEPQFEAELRDSLTMSQLRTGIVVSAFATPSEIERRLELLGEQREVDYAVVPAAGDAIEVGDEEIEKLYTENPGRYMTPESVDLAYVELTLDDVAQEVEVTDDGLRAYYEQVRERYVAPERRRARHILIESGDDDAAALEKAEDVAARVRAGEDFAALAGSASQDPGSAEKGGDLGWATRGMFVGAFEDALFGMAVGDIAGPVKTQFGYHVIRLEEIDPGHVREFDEVRPDLEAEYRREQAANLFYERSQRLADEAFANLEEIEPVAEALGLEVHHIDDFTRAGGGELGDDPEVIEVAFTPDVAERGENSPLIQLGDERVVVVHATDHRLPEPQPLAVVRGEIVSHLRASKARDAARVQGEQLVEALRQGGDWTQLLAAADVEPNGARFVGRDAQDIPAAVRTAAFKALRPAPGKTTVYDGTALPSGDFAIVRVTDVRKGGSGEDAASERAALAQRASREAGTAEFSAYLAELERTADVDRNPAPFE
jgi:peptidyl-prolyl cis-trans isomerase D